MKDQMNSTRRKNILLTGAVFAGLASLSMVPNAAMAEEAATVGELVVTATKRASTVQDAPIAITAIAGAQIERQRIQTFSDLAPLVPGARYNNPKGSIGQIVLRGQYTVNDSPALEVPVGTFIDELYYGTLGSFDADFFDVEQVAVLRGPQGTTFGRNTVGGAVQITSNKPNFDGFSAFASATVSDRPGIETRGTLNLPINDVLAGRIAFSTHNVDGWKKNVDGSKLDDNKSFSVRGSLRFKPNDSLDANLGLTWYHKDNLGAGGRLFGQGSLVQSLNAANPKYSDVYQDNLGYDRRDAGAAVLTVNYDAKSLGTFTSVTGYRVLDAKVSEDIDTTPAAVLLNSNNSKEWAFSQELRLASPSGRRLEYVVGAYYSFESLYKSVPQANRGGSNPQAFVSVLTRGQDQFQIPEQRARVLTLAPFGEVEYHVTDQFSLVAGVRYTYEDKDGFTNHIGSSAFYGAPYEVDFGKTWDAWTPRFIAKFSPTDEINLYASASKGFKGGGWSLVANSVAAALKPLEPETSWSYEAGAKTRWLDGRLTANVAVYKAITKNLQVRSIVNGVFTDANAGKAEVKGVEVETRFNITPDAWVAANYAYTDAKYASFKNCTAAGLDCSGNRLPYTPKNDFTVSAGYGFDAPALNGRLTVSGDVRFQGTVLFTPQNISTVGDYAPAIAKTKVKGETNLALLFEPESSDWDVRFWVRNLTDLKYFKAYSNYYFYILTPAEVGAGLYSAGRAYYADPRTVGVTLTYRK